MSRIMNESNPVKNICFIINKMQDKKVKKVKGGGLFGKNNPTSNKTKGTLAVPMTTENFLMETPTETRLRSFEEKLNKKLNEIDEKYAPWDKFMSHNKAIVKINEDIVKINADIKESERKREIKADAIESEFGKVYDKIDAFIDLMLEGDQKKISEYAKMRRDIKAQLEEMKRQQMGSTKGGKKAKPKSKSKPNAKK